MKTVVLPIQKEHLSAVAELEAICFSEPWSISSLQHLLSDEARGFVACTEEGKVIGYVGVWNSVGEGQITNLATLPEYRRNGVGRALMEAVLSSAKENDWTSISLEVRVSNLPAILLYQKLGFRDVGRRKHFYKNPSEDAVIMLLEKTAD